MIPPGHNMTLKRLNFLLFVLLLPFAGVSVDAQGLIPIDVDVEALGKGATGTVVRLAVRIAPEDRALVGHRLQLGATLLVLHREPNQPGISSQSLIDHMSAVVALDAKGSVTIYREWLPGSYYLKVTVNSLSRPVFGLWSREVEIPTADLPFEPPAATAASAYEVTPPKNNALHFIPIPGLNSIDDFHVGVVIPDGTASVEFFQGSELFERRTRPPWSIRVPMRMVIQRSEIRAIALDAVGRYLGEDAIVINRPAGERLIKILIAPDSAVRNGRRPITVAVYDQRDFQQLRLSLDDEVVARWKACPCITEIAVADVQNAKVLYAEVVDFDGNRFVDVKATEGNFEHAVRVDLVELQVQVFDSHDVPVIGLDRLDFSVFEDGREIEIEGVGTSQDQQLLLVIVVDSSGSMTENFPAVRQAVIGFAEDVLTRGDRAVLIRFSTNTEVLVPWSENMEDIERGLAEVETAGSTSLNDAIIESLMQFHGLRGRKAVVLLTDGEENSSFAGFVDTMWFSHSMRIPIYSIRLFTGNPRHLKASDDSASEGMEVSGVRARQHLETLAKNTGGQTYFRIQIEKLPKVYEEISEILRSQYLLWYRPDPNKASDGFRSITVKVDKPNLKVRTISGYYVGR